MRSLLLAFVATVMLLVAPAAAQDITLSDGTVVANLPEHLMPALVKHMTPEQFAEYAAIRNQQAERRADEYARSYRATRQPAPATLVTSTTGGTEVFAAVAGPTATGRVGRGAANHDSIYYEDSRQNYVTKQQSILYKDHNDGGGGPVLYINPYAFDYWRRHTVAD